MKMFIRLAILTAVIVLSQSVLPAQTTATFGVMHDKLSHSEKLLEAVMTANFVVLERESAALAEATKAPGWAVLKTPQYVRYSNDFLHAAQDLQDAAKEHDLDAAALRYTSMTLTCYQCHRYIRRARIAR